MNELMTKWFGQSWRTTVGGVLLGFPPSVMAAVVAAGYATPKWLVLATTLLTSVGALVLGSNAKDAQVHSTPAQVTTSGIQNPAIQATAVVEEKQAAVVAADSAPASKLPEVKP